MSIAEDKNVAFNWLVELEKTKVTLTRDVFFVPGWTSENCAAWLSPYTKENISMAEWAKRLIRNSNEKVHFIQFTEEESKTCKNFLDFGKILGEKVKPFLDGTQIDLIGHSMGGLDISAALLNGLIPMGSVKNVVTLGSPFHGAEWGEVMKTVSKFSWFFPGAWALIRHALKNRYSYYHLLQLEHMNPAGPTIKTFNKTENRVKFLEGIGKLHTFVGTDDDMVKKSAFFNGYKIPESLLSAKLSAISFDGATHSGLLGLPQDLRVICDIIKILSI